MEKVEEIAPNEADLGKKAAQTGLSLSKSVAEEKYGKLLGILEYDGLSD